jgi:hypothetical protein
MCLFNRIKQVYNQGPMLEDIPLGEGKLGAHNRGPSTPTSPIETPIGLASQLDNQTRPQPVQEGPTFKRQGKKQFEEATRKDAQEGVSWLTSLVGTTPKEGRLIRDLVFWKFPEPTQGMTLEEAFHASVLECHQGIPLSSYTTAQQDIQDIYFGKLLYTSTLTAKSCLLSCNCMQHLSTTLCCPSLVHPRSNRRLADSSTTCTSLQCNYHPLIV